MSPLGNLDFEELDQQHIEFLKDVFKIYSAPEQIKKAGLHNGGLDVGIDVA